MRGVGKRKEGRKIRHMKAAWYTMWSRYKLTDGGLHSEKLPHSGRGWPTQTCPTLLHDGTRNDKSLKGFQDNEERNHSHLYCTVDGNTAPQEGPVSLHKATVRIRFGMKGQANKIARLADEKNPGPNRIWGPEGENRRPCESVQTTWRRIYRHTEHLRTRQQSSTSIYPLFIKYLLRPCRSWVR